MERVRRYVRTWGNTNATTVNREAWDMILGAKRDSSTGIQVPGRLADLSNLPPTFINVGECEVFRDSAVAFAR